MQRLIAALELDTRVSRDQRVKVTSIEKDQNVTQKRQQTTCFILTMLGCLNISLFRVLASKQLQ
jgi:hypothetical protein